MKYFNWHNIRLLIIMGMVVFLYAFSGERNKHRKLTKSEVIFTGENNLYVTKDAVNKLLIEKNKPAKSIAVEWVDLNKLEKTVERHEMVEKSEVFVGIDGVLKAVVTQKTPIARVFDKDSSFYLDAKGKRMPLSEVYTARVPIVSGDLSENHLEGLAKVLRMINDDAFLKKNIIGVRVTPSGGLMLENRNFDYEIDYGRPVNVDRKFANYKAFFQKAVQDSTIKKYKKINLRFNNQVVCTK